MTPFQISLDRYLTSEPEDGFTPYCEQVYDFFDDRFYAKYEMNNRFMDKVDNKWLSKLYSKGYSPKDAANLIKKAFVNAAI